MWDEVAADKRNGIITGYNITYESETENDDGNVLAGPDSSLVWSFYSALLRSPCVPCAFPLLICITVKSMTSPIVIT